MLGLFKRKLDDTALVAVCPTEDGIPCARVRRFKDQAPVLELCKIQPLDHIGIQGAEIARLARSERLDNQACVTTLEVGNYSLLLVEAPDVPASELRAAIRWRVKDLIDFHIDDAVIDVFDVPNQRMSGGNKMMYAVVTKASIVRRQVDLLTVAGLNLEVIDIPELALRNIAALLPEDVAGVAMVYLYPRGGLITITRQTTLYLSRRIDTGYEVLGGDLDSATPRLDRIVVEIQRSLDYYDSHFSQPPVTNIAIAPIPERIAGMDVYLSRQLGITVRMLDLNALIDAETPMQPEVQSRCLLAIGAALRVESKEL